MTESQEDRWIGWVLLLAVTPWIVAATRWGLDGFPGLLK